jgi:hypothetical protein
LPYGDARTHGLSPLYPSPPSTKELRDLYTPTPEDRAFVDQLARGPAQKLALMLLFKVYQRLWYFPDPHTIPRGVIDHIRTALAAPADLVPGMSPATHYRYYAAIREELHVIHDAAQVRLVAARAMYAAAVVREHPADLINAALDTLIARRCELPAFSTLDRLAGQIRTRVHDRLYRTIQARLTQAEQRRLEQLLEREDTSREKAFHRIKEAPKSASLTHLEEWLSRLTWLQSLGNMEPLVAGQRPAKIGHLTEEARSLHATDLRDCAHPKRLALLVCLIYQATIATRDEIVQMVLKRMSTLTQRAKEELERVRAAERETTKHLIDVLSEVAHASVGMTGVAVVGQQVQAVLDRQGGALRLLDQCEQVSAHHGDRYQPFLKRFYGSHRKALFRVLKTLDLRSTTADQTLVDAIVFVLAHEHTTKTFLEATIELPFASDKWLRTVLVRHKGKCCFVRQHLETCVFSYVAAELRSGGLCVVGSEQFAGYREQLLSWEDCAPKVAEYCQRLGLPATAEGLVAHIQAWLTEVSTQVDQTRPDNHDLIITEQGEPALRKLPAKRPPAGLVHLEEALQDTLPERHLQDILCRVDHWTGFTRHFGPLSGNAPKGADARAKQLLTIFAYASGLGPHQMARHLRGTYSAEHLAQTNRLHMSADQLDAAGPDVINQFHRLTLPLYWGDEKRAAEDGTQYELAEENLLAEQHIRYGGYGGITYHHVSDLYILLFSHFISCGVWEAVYILDILMRNRSTIQPDTLHADKQGQNLPVFDLAYLLGIQLMPRIRHWKDLKFYRPTKETVYEHLEPLFGDNVIDWTLIQTHWQDLMQVVISI